MVSDHPWASKTLIYVLQVLSTRLLGRAVTASRSGGVLGSPAELPRSEGVR